jgi:hypothetical protein
MTVDDSVDGSREEAPDEPESADPRRTRPSRNDVFSADFEGVSERRRGRAASAVAAGVGGVTTDADRKRVRIEVDPALMLGSRATSAASEVQEVRLIEVGVDIVLKVGLEIVSLRV